MKKLIGKFFVMDVQDELDPNPEGSYSFPWWSLIILIPIALFGIYFIISFVYNVFFK